MQGSATQASNNLLVVVAPPDFRLVLHTHRTAVDAPANFGKSMLAAARKLTASREMLLWMTPSEAPKALQASDCSDLLDPMRASCGIFAQH